MYDETKKQGQGEDPTTLLAHDYKTNQVSAVKGIAKKGKLKTVPPERKNESQFIRIDKQGDAFTNFYSNFLRQLKNPTRFAFFIVKTSEAPQKAKSLQKLADRPNKEESQDRIISTHEKINSKVPNYKNQTKMETNQNDKTVIDNRFEIDQIDWKAMNSMGLSRERLEKMNVLETLLKGFKTNELVPVTINLGTALAKTDARLSLQADESGNVTVAIHGVRRAPNLNLEFFGHKFTTEDKHNLLQSGNMGRVVELTNLKTGEPIPSIISIDRLTNEIVALRTEHMKIPDEIKGVRLNDEQKETLLQGRPLQLEGMTSKKGEPFDATVQYNADKRYVEFIFDRNLSNKIAQSPIKNGQLTEPPKTFRGKELDQEQYEKLKTGQPVFINGLQDRKGREYQGYIVFDKDKGSVQFSFPNTSKTQTKNQNSSASELSAENQKNPVQEKEQNENKKRDIAESTGTPIQANAKPSKTTTRKL